ncbi:hypothetical protein HDV03_000200 [Kappamyces sp. JEL0829]|nr:hypothetical protein HDV03_000200 [Kappamyces sp. JEL0829]
MELGMPPAQSVPRTSVSHPIRISWLLSDGDLPRIQKAKPKARVEQVAAQNGKRRPRPHDYNPIKRMEFEVSEAALEHAVSPMQSEKMHLQGCRPFRVVRGNFALSSCPGKQVRLDFRAEPCGRPSVKRSLELDLQRIANSNISTIINCLDDEELAYLGAGWPDYEMLAQRLGLQVVRIPIKEGAAPNTIQEVEDVLDEIDRRGGNTLAHCRGGIGRAGVIAACFLLRRGYFKSVRSVVLHLRSRRSVKAIETNEQLQFLHSYHAHLCRDKV